MSWLRRLFGSSSEEEQEEWTASEDSAPSSDWQTPRPYPPFSETQQDSAPSSDRQTPLPPPPTSHRVPTQPFTAPPRSKEELEVLQLIQQAARDRVTTLDLSRRGITKLPPEIGQLTNLTTLDLRYNQLSSLPAEIGQLTNLTRLDLNGNDRLSTLPSQIGHLTNLEVLVCHCHDLMTLPLEIGKLTKLNTLLLSSSFLTTLPPEIEQLSNLTTLDIRGPRAMMSTPTGHFLSDDDFGSFHTVPPEIGKLYKLRFLLISDCPIAALPAEIGQLTNLTILRLYYNQLSSLPAEIGQLTNLTELDLSGNLLSSLPAEIGQLTSLTTLCLSSSNLSSLPAWIGQLTNLTSLDLHRNKLSTLPPEITQLTNLERLDLGDNWRLPIPPEILWRRNDPATILDYYFRERKKPLNEAKLVFVGEGRVGKTSLVRGLVEGQFDPDEAITEGIAIQEWKVGVGEGEVKLNIWDFGGQEIMHGTHQFFLTLRSLYVLVLDVQEDEAGNRLEYWLKMIESFGADSPIIVVINQIDQPRKLYLNRAELLRNYPNIKAFVETSCQSGEGMAKLEEQITSQIGSLAHVKDEIPIEWLAVKRQLEGLGKDYVAYDDYIALCQANHVREEKEQGVLLSLLHELGVVLHFKDDPRLSEMNVLNPFWATGGVYQIIHAKSILKRQGISELGELEQGILSVGQLDQILDQEEYPREKHLFILGLMRKFELCFELAGNTGEKFLIPELLPPTQPTFSWHVDCLNFEYHYDFLPRSVISRFIVRMCNSIFKEMAWRNGVRLVNNTNQALVKALPRSKRIVISLSGEGQGRLEFWHKIRAEFDKIHQSIKGLNARLKIPVYKPPLCPDCNALNRIGAKYCRQCGHSIPLPSDKEPICQDCGAQNRPRASFCSRCGLALYTYTPPAKTVDYHFLRNLQQKGIEEYPVDVGDDVVVVNVRELLEGVKPAPKVVESPKVAALKETLAELRVGVHPQSFYHVTFLLGQLYYEQIGDYTLARQALVDGHEAIEALRGMVQEEIQVQLSADSVRLYEMLVRSYLVEGDDEKAFEYAAAAKGRAFVNRLAEARVDLKKMTAEKPEFASQLTQAREKRQEIDQLEQQIGTEGANQDELRGKQNVLLREEGELWREMARDYPALTATLSVPSLSAKDARALAKELHATLVEYYRHSDGWCAFVVTAEGVQHFDLPDLNEKLLQDLLSWRNKLHLRVGRNPFVLNRLDRLHKAAITPLKHVMPLKEGSERVVIAPFERLHLLPLSAARHAKRYLADEYTLSFAPSLTALYVVNQERKQRSPPNVGGGKGGAEVLRLLSVAYPGTGKNYLPNVLDEAKAIMERLGSVARIGILHQEEATPEHVICEAPAYDMIHFSCHGRFKSDKPEESGLRLAGATKEEAYLTVQRIMTELNLKQSRLATLAACLTGEVKLQEGEEHIGLLQAMMTAGVQTVVASLWHVDDAATRALFEAFYYREADIHSAPLAMRDASQLLRRSFSHPYYWAAFTVNGFPPQKRRSPSDWPPDLLAHIEKDKQRSITRGITMNDQLIKENAEVLLETMWEFRSDILPALRQHQLSDNLAQQSIEASPVEIAKALLLIVEDNPTLRQAFLEGDVGKIRLDEEQDSDETTRASRLQEQKRIPIRNKVVKVADFLDLYLDESNELSSTGEDHEEGFLSRFVAVFRSFMQGKGNQ